MTGHINGTLPKSGGTNSIEECWDPVIMKNNRSNIGYKNHSTSKIKSKIPALKQNNNDSSRSWVDSDIYQIVDQEKHKSSLHPSMKSKQNICLHFTDGCDKLSWGKNMWIIFPVLL